MAPVEKGDIIFLSNIDGADKKVEWMQRMSQKTADYGVLGYEIKTKASTGAAPSEADKTGVLFVEKSKLEEFKSKAMKPDYTLTVTTDFQYGQVSKDGAKRWLVFHDKNHKIFQHRFFENLYFPVSAVDTWKGIHLDDLLTTAEQLKGIIGQNLHDF